MLYERGKYDEAVQAYDNATVINPKYAKAWNNKGNATTSIRNSTAAGAALLKLRS